MTNLKPAIKLAIELFNEAKAQGCVGNALWVDFIKPAIEMLKAKPAINAKALIEAFWDAHKAEKRKTKKAAECKAQEDKHYAAKKIVDAGIIADCGKYADFIQKWANAELITNNFGKHLYWKAG